MESRSCKVEKGAVKTTGEWNTKLQEVSADDKIVIELKLCSGREHDKVVAKR